MIRKFDKTTVAKIKTITDQYSNSFSCGEEDIQEVEVETTTRSANDLMTQWYQLPRANAGITVMNSDPKVNPAGYLESLWVNADALNFLIQDEIKREKDENDLEGPNVNSHTEYVPWDCVETYGGFLRRCLAQQRVSGGLTGEVRWQRFNSRIDVDIVKGNARSKTAKRDKLKTEMQDRLHDLFYDIYVYEKKVQDKKENPEHWTWDQQINSFKDGSDSLKRWLKNERRDIERTAELNAKQKYIIRREKGMLRLAADPYKDVVELMKKRAR